MRSNCALHSRRWRTHRCTSYARLAPSTTRRAIRRQRSVPSYNRQGRWFLVPRTQLTTGKERLVAMKFALASYGTRGDIEPSRSEEHTSELQSLMRISYAVFCLKKKKKKHNNTTKKHTSIHVKH